MRFVLGIGVAVARRRRPRRRRSCRPATGCRIGARWPRAPARTRSGSRTAASTRTAGTSPARWAACHAAAEARRRRLVRRQRPVGRAGDPVHERLGLHALQAAVDRRARAPAHRRGARRRARRAVRAQADQPEPHAPDRDGHRRRPLGADGPVPVGLRRRRCRTRATTCPTAAPSPAARSRSATQGGCRARRRHYYAAFVGSDRRASGGQTGAGHSGRPARAHVPDGGAARRRCRASATTARSATAPAASCATA